LTASLGVRLCSLSLADLHHISSDRDYREGLRSDMVSHQSRWL
jgi:hypothetical protein